MKKIFTAIFLLLLLIGTFTLKDYSEIEQTAIASSLFFEESTDGYSVTVQIIKKYGEENKSVTATGKTPEECIKNIDNTLIKKLSLSHCGVVAIDKNCNGYSLAEILSFLKDYNTFPLSAYIVFTNAAEIYATDYSLTQYINNKNKEYPLYSVMYDAYSTKKIKLPVIHSTDNGYAITDYLEKEVLF